MQEQKKKLGPNKDVEFMDDDEAKGAKEA